MMVTLVSAKGSPGVTATALALAATASGPARSRDWGPVLLVEADLTGGDLECWTGPHGEPGLLRAVTAVRANGRSGRWRDRDVAVPVVPGVSAVLAPTTEVAATAALASASGWLAHFLSRLQGTVIVDRGRWSAGAGQDHGGLVEAAALVAVVCRPTMASVEHARGLIPPLRRVNPRVGVIVVGGTDPYPPEEIAASTSAPLFGVLSWDPRGVARLVEHGASRGWQRSRLAVDAEGVLDALEGLRRRGARELSAHG